MTVETWAEVGERVREARLATGQSQGQLADAIGVDRTAVVRVEAGKRQLSALELFALADALGLPPAHFVSRPPAAMVSRRRSVMDAPDAPARARFVLDAALEAHARDAEQLIRYGVLTPAPPPPDQKVATSEEAGSFARDVRRVLNKESGPLGPMVAEAEKVGLFITVVALDVDGASLDLGGCGVAVIGNTEPGRRRWTAAHELGHYLMQDEYSSDVGVSASRDEREQLVDAFAAELLLPTQDLLRLAADGGTDLRESLIRIAGEYRVSWTAVVDRARQVGVVDTAIAQELRARSPVLGDFLAIVGVAPEPDLPVGDHGPLWTQAVVRANRENLLTRERAVELLGGAISINDLPEPYGKEPW